MEPRSKFANAKKWLRKAQAADIRASGRFLRANRYTILRVFVLLLRFGQVAATGILALIYFYFIYKHRTHACRSYYRSDYRCRWYELAAEPWSYTLILIASIASFLQLFLLACFKLRVPTSSSPRHIQATYTRPHAHFYGFLLSRSDIIILILYIIAFISLSDYIVPTGILRGARSGTTCYRTNLSNMYSPVVMQQCILGQHGYWWAMGAMLSYLITSTLSAIVFVEASTIKRNASAYKTGPIALPDGPLENGSESENMPLLAGNTADGNDLLISGEE